MSNLPTPPLARPIPLARPAEAAAAPPIAYATIARTSPFELPGVTRDQAVWDVALVLTATLALPYGSHLVLAPFVTASAEMPESALVLVLGKTIEMSIAVVVAAYLVFRNGVPARALGLTSRAPLRQLAWAAVGLIGCYAAMLTAGLVVIGLVTAFPSLMGDLKQRIDFARQLPVGSFATQLPLILAVAIHEELIFRGLLLPGLKRVTGRWWLAILLSSVLFAALHIPGQGALAAIQVTVLGAALAVVFVLSRSLPAVILAHAAFDLIQIQLIKLLPALEGVFDEPVATLLG